MNATAVEACISHLATKLNIKVDVSARASGECSSGNCNGSAGANVGISDPTSGKGCASAPGSSNGVTGVLGLLGVAIGASALRVRRRNKNSR